LPRLACSKLNKEFSVFKVNPSTSRKLKVAMCDREIKKNCASCEKERKREREESWAESEEKRSIRETLHHDLTP